MLGWHPSSNSFKGPAKDFKKFNLHILNILQQIMYLANNSLDAFDDIWGEVRNLGMKWKYQETGQN